MEDTVVFFDELVSLIKEKKELSTLDDAFVASVLSRFLTEKIVTKVSSYDTFKKFKRAKEIKQLVADVRKYLREVYGLFIKQSLPDMYKKLSRKEKSLDQIAQLVLQSHQSSFERFGYYATVYELLFDKLKELGLPDDFILGDFACGCNPFAYSYLPIKPKNYLVCDLSSADMQVVNEFFSSANIAGQAFAFDVLSDDFASWSKQQSFDVVFLFKALDSLEAVSRHASKPFLVSLPTNFLVVSFALRSIGGKQSIAGSRRVWFEHFCQKQGWSIDTFQVPNELFYVVKCK